MTKKKNKIIRYTGSTESLSDNYYVIPKHEIDATIIDVLTKRLNNDTEMNTFDEVAQFIKLVMNDMSVQIDI